jgi:hypothetical protein
MQKFNVDYLSRSGARLLQRCIQDYWKARGKFPVIRVDAEGVDPNVYYVVCSDMLGGRPL